MPISPHIAALRAKVGTDRLVAVGVSAVVLDDAGHVLLVRDATHGDWMPVGGMVEPGEEPAAAAVREVFEEAGVRCAAEHLVGVYDGPDVTYANGDRVSYLTVAFRCRAVDATLHPDGEEVTDARFFPPDQLPALRPDHARNVAHALARQPAAFFVVDANPPT